MGTNELATAGPLKPLLYVLGGCSAVVPTLWFAMQLLGEIEGLAVLLILTVFVTALVFGITYCSTIILAFGSRRWQPAATGLVAGVAAMACAAPIALPSPIKAVWIPLATAAVAASTLIRARDLDLMNDSPKGSVAQWLCILTTAVIGLWVGVAAEVGKPILIALNQDVVGVIQSEKIEIAVAGGIAGGAFGLVCGTLAYSAFSQNESPANNCVNRSGESGPN
ncbi:hypothetical protein [Crateriforma conspicua]|uniref:hypothetical protein n=1 Tax=Crateriforma spongiae TaxID=2724528 RepID=UPI0011B8415B